MRRLLFLFLPHLPLFLATLLATGVYAAADTARVTLVYPLVRLFAEEAPDGEEAAAGEEEQPPGEPEAAAETPGLGGSIEAVERVIAARDSRFSPALRHVNDFLDVMDAATIDLLTPILPERVQADPKRLAQVGTIATVTVLLLALTVISALSNFLKHFLKSVLVVRILVRLRVRLLENLLRQELAFYNEQKRGELISRMSSDVQSSTHCLDLLTGDMLVQPLKVLFPVAGVAFVKWWLVFPVLGFLALISFSLRKQMRKVHRRAKVRQRTTARVTEAMVQMFSGIRVVKAFGLEAEKVNEYTRRNDEFARDAVATELAKAFSRTWMEAMTNLAMVVAVVVGGVFLGTGSSAMPLGAMALLLLMMAQIYRPAKMLTNAYTDLQDNLAGAERTFEFMTLRPGLRDKPGATVLTNPVGTVRFENVSFSYQGNGRVLNHINLEVPAGQVVALVGPSGAGKSTMVNLVPRFYDPDSGRITIDGTDLREFTRSSLLRHIAIVTQEPFLFNTSVRENIAYGKPNASSDEIVAAAKAANIHEFIMTLPRGYETLVGERGANLSGGQGQRITIARAIIRDARILILDEATSSLDSESERAVQQALQNLMRDRTTLVIAHRLSTIQHADKICVMQDGQICEMGSHSQLMTSDSLYRRLYELQFAPE